MSGCEKRVSPWPIDPLRLTVLYDHLVSAAEAVSDAAASDSLDERLSACDEAQADLRAAMAILEPYVKREERSTCQKR